MTTLHCSSVYIYMRIHTYVREWCVGFSTYLYPATTGRRRSDSSMAWSCRLFRASISCVSMLYLPLEAKNAVRFVKLYNLVHEGLELLTELHASLLGATSFHMYKQYAYFWLGLASYMHVYMSYSYSLVITE